MTQSGDPSRRWSAGFHGRHAGSRRAKRSRREHKMPARRDYRMIQQGRSIPAWFGSDSRRAR